VLAPSAEQTAAIFDAVQRQHLEAGERVWPTPRVRDIGSFLIERHLQRQLRDPGLPRILDAIEERELWRRVVLQSRWSETLLEPAGAAEAARRARRAMFEHGIPAAALADHPGEETAALLDWIAGFEARCRALSAISPDALLGSLGPPAEKIAWIESPGWRPVLRGWLRTHADRGPLPAPAAPAVAARALCAATSHEELAALADWAQASLCIRPTSRLWICIPDLRARRAAVVDAYDAVLAPQRFALGGAARAPGPDSAAYAIAGGTPLADYAPVRAALEALALCSGPLPFERFSAVLRSPELQQNAADTLGAARLDVLLRADARSEMPLSEWLALGRRLAARLAPDAVAALLRLGQLEACFAAGPAMGLPSEWARHWIALFEAGPWAHAERWSSGEFQAAERFREVLARLAAADQSLGVQRRAAAEALLAGAAQDTLFQPETGIAPVWITGQLIDPWLAYDGIWIAGLAGQRWPPPAEPVPLLPVAVQVRYGVVSAAAAAQLAAARALQDLWPQRAAELVYSCAGTVEAGVVSLSPLLRDVAVAAELPAVQPRPHWHRQWSAAPSFEMWVDESAPPLGSTERTRGVATLRAQSRCPFRGFAATRLEAEALTRPTPGFSSLERGIIVHAALEGIWGQLRDSDALQALAPDAQGALLAHWAAAAVESGARRRDPGAVWQRRERERLEVLLARWLEVERLRQPFTVEELESATCALILGGLEFRCRIDRVDRLVDGTRVLIDYKTGTQQPDWRGERPDNPQLPVYALLRPDALAAVAYAQVNASESGFVHESARRGIFWPASPAGGLEGAATFGALVDVWRERMTRLAAEFAAGQAAVNPSPSACRSCDLQGLCRIGARHED
jgi:probable DNA repair protein